MTVVHYNCMGLYVNLSKSTRSLETGETEESETFGKFSEDLAVKNGSTNAGRLKGNVPYSHMQQA